MWNSILIRSTWWGLLHRPLLHMSHCHCHLTYYLKQGSHIFAGLRHVLACQPLVTTETTNFLLLSATTSILLVLLSVLFLHISGGKRGRPPRARTFNGVASLLEFLVGATTKIALGTLPHTTQKLIIRNPRTLIAEHKGNNNNNGRWNGK